MLNYYHSITMEIVIITYTLIKTTNDNQLTLFVIHIHGISTYNESTLIQ